MPKRLTIAIALWTVAGSLMTTGLVERIPALRGVAILVGLMACVPSGWLVVEHVVSIEREKAVRAICQAIGYAQAEENVRQIH